MPEEWTGALVMKMHNNRIRRAELAQELDHTAAYVSMVLNGKRKPKGIRERMEAAVDRLIERNAVG